MTPDTPPRPWEEPLTSALVQRDEEAIARALEDVHSADLADLFLELDEPEQILLLSALDDEQAATLLEELEPHEQSEMLDLLTVERTSDILEEMSADEAADLLADLPTEEANALLERMEPEAAEDVTELMRYPEDSAGGLMTTEFVALAPEQTVTDVLAILRTHHDDAEMIYTLFVLDAEERLLGEVTLRDLIAAAPATAMADLMAREFVSVPVDLPQDEVAELVRRHDLLAVPVLDADGRMRGIVTVDDVGEVVQDEAADDLLETSGSAVPAETPSAWPVLPGWRTGLLALLGGVGSALLIWWLATVLRGWRDVALLLPLVLVLGITAGNQAALALDRAYESSAERRHVGRVFRREVLAGAVLAVIGGLLAAALIFFLHHQRVAVPAIAIPTALGLWTAAIAGALGALLLRRGGDTLRPASHTLIVSLALLLAIAVYLLTAHWLTVAWGVQL